MDERKCIECGGGVDKEWLKKSNVVVPLCPACYEKLKHLFEELAPQSTELSS